MLDNPQISEDTAKLFKDELFWLGCAPLTISLRRSAVWWSQTGSNRRPHACKARALPTELWPHFGLAGRADMRGARCACGPSGRSPNLSGQGTRRIAPQGRSAVLRVSQGRGRGRRRLRISIMVGLGGFEPPTSRLSSARSNQLSYKPEPCADCDCSQSTRDRARPRRKRNEDGGVPHDRPDWP